MKPFVHIFTLSIALFSQSVFSVQLFSKDALNTHISSTWTYKNSKIIFHAPDNPSDPIAWEGPLEIVNKAGSKKFGIELPSELHIINDALIVISTSGSTYYLDMIDIDKNVSIVKNKEIGGNVQSIDNRYITIYPTCECVEKDMCVCNQAQVFSWDIHGLMYEQNRSKALTEELLGVCFKGTKKIPKSSIKMKL